MRRQLTKNKTVLVILIAILMIGLMAVKVIPNQVRASITLSESSSSISAYSDSQATVILTNINWGPVTLNAPDAQSFYLEDTGSAAYILTALTLTDFVFRDSGGNVISTDYSQDFSVTTNRIGAIMSSGQIMSTELTLVISGNIGRSVASFSFNVVLNFNQLVSPADLIGNGKVNAADMFYFVGGYIAYNTQGIYNATCDLNHDGVINSEDFFLFVNYYIAYWSS